MSSEVCSRAGGGGGSCAEGRALIGQIGKGRDSKQDGAFLLARRSGGGTLRLKKLVHWSEASRGGATHVGSKSAKLRPGRSSSGLPLVWVGDKGSRVP